MDFSYYNRIENDKANVSYSKLVKLLNKMDISMEEFTFLKERKAEYSTIHRMIAEAHYSENIKQLKYLRNLYNKKFENSNSWSDRYVYILCTYLLNLRTGKKLDQVYIDEVIDYLNSISYYTRNDVIILVNFYNLLPSEMVFYLFDKTFITKRRYSAFEISNRDVMLFYFNVIDLAIRKEKYNLAKKILELAKKEFSNPLELLANLEFNYYDGLFLIITKQDVQKGISMVEKEINNLMENHLNYPAKYHREALEIIKERNNENKT